MVYRYIISASDVVDCISNYGNITPTSKMLLLDNRHISEANRKSKYSSYVHSNLISKDITKLPSLQSYNTAADAAAVEDIEKTIFNPSFMPLMAESFESMPSTYIVTAHHDVLRDDGLFYAARLSNTSNVQVSLKNYREGFHAFFHFSQGPLRLHGAQIALNDLIEFLKERILDD